MPQNEGLQNLQALIGETYLVADPYIVKVMLASAVAQFLPGDPAWLIVVGPSGGGKSEFVNMLSKVAWTPPGKAPQKVWPISAITANTLISGAKNSKQETSLLLKISNGIITFKDFTSLLSEKPDVRSVIMGQLREIYDGKYDKQYGTGEGVSWTGKITVVAGATYSVHTLRQAYTAMGERFTFYHMLQPDRQAAARKTMDNQEEGKMLELREAIAVAVAQLAKEILDAMPATLPKIDKDTQNNMILLAELATRARSPIEHDWHSPKKEILEANPAEMPTRFAGGLQTYAQAFKVINNYIYGAMTLLEEDNAIIYKLALDSITNMRRKALTELAKYGSATTAAIATSLNLPTSTLSLHLQDLNALGLIDRSKAIKGRADNWSIKDQYRGLLARFDNITQIAETAPEAANEDGFDRSQYEGEPSNEKIDDINAQLDLGGGVI
jgi:DNA-binding MarR family transcriptional regulator/energy-coupling factor transporter ATP-binding protein EcfA2